MNKLEILEKRLSILKEQLESAEKGGGKKAITVISNRITFIENKILELKAEQE